MKDYIKVLLSDIKSNIKSYENQIEILEIKIETSKIFVEKLEKALKQPTEWQKIKERDDIMNLKIFTKNIEEQAINQINELLKQEAFKNSKVRIMPDVHAGKGCVIGFTGNLGEKVIPNIVGVDIGCGILCVELGNIDLDLKKLDEINNLKEK